MDKKKYITFLFRRVTPDRLKEILESELSDQVPCFWKHMYDNFEGFKKYFKVVVEGISDFVFYGYTKHDVAIDGEEENEIIKKAVILLFADDIKKYYDDSDCSHYLKQDVFESKNSKPSKETISRIRRLQELRDSIEFQITLQDPCNFDDGEDYADFCISEGLGFFYGDEGYTDYDDDGNWRVMSDTTNNSDDYAEREDVEKLMYEEYYDQLIKEWENFTENNNCG